MIAISMHSVAAVDREHVCPPKSIYGTSRKSGYTHGPQVQMFWLEARVGIEPTDKGFADHELPISKSPLFNPGVLHILAPGQIWAKCSSCASPRHRCFYRRT